MSAKQEYRKANMKKAAVIACFFLLVAVALYYIGVLDSKNENVVEEGNSSEEKVLNLDGVEYVQNKDIETVLVVGLDKYAEEAADMGYRNPNCADFVMLLALDHKNQSYKAIQINRDTYTDVEVITLNNKNYTEKMQLALSYTYGSGTLKSLNNTAKSVSGLFYGVDIDKKVSVKLDAVPIVNDMVSGVTLTLLDDFTAFDTALVKDTKVTLNGEQALLYVRARAGMEDSSNSRRMERQRQYLDALYECVVKTAKEDDTFALQAVAKVSDCLVTDCLNVELTSLFDKISSYSFQGIINVEGESKPGEKYMEFYPDEDKLEKLAVETFYIKK